MLDEFLPIPIAVSLPLHCLVLVLKASLSVWPFLAKGQLLPSLHYDRVGRGAAGAGLGHNYLWNMHPNIVLFTIYIYIYLNIYLFKYLFIYTIDNIYGISKRECANVIYVLNKFINDLRAKEKKCCWAGASASGAGMALKGGRFLRVLAVACCMASMLIANYITQLYGRVYVTVVM